MKKVVVQVKTGCRTQEVILLEDVYQVKLKSKPIDGKANQELCVLLAHTWQLNLNQVIILKGLSSHQKMVGIVR